MQLEELKAFIESELKETQEYDRFLETEIKERLTPNGLRHYEHLHFFNMGFEMALGKVKSYLEKDDAHDNH